ncbi:phosphoribosylanthranilate isomerase [Exiguobacterium marinum]|uniref:N-(5'-phosphoribosyl)anthranilate isomerase n=1 Tax=Exiguobacterium marinum TaxID=273528 RepID=A0ABY7WXU3_9BACL|nr:phosphoribosylanthranilate isomerase [Exiguobacterium marinum]WDH75668.1 phosphoribosylanthranilate isomerase [Exiguobacterium marinum]
MFVKICGLKTEEAVQAAVEAGADAIGFVFAPSSRQIDVSRAKELAAYIPESVRIVGVFLSPSMEDIEQALDVGLTDLQIHHRTQSIEQLRTFGLPIIDASTEEAADVRLMDHPTPGSGQVLDWGAIDRPKHPFWLAGGLSPDNVRQAIQTIQPDGVDISSGVETDGVKDIKKIRAFIQRAKEEL